MFRGHPHKLSARNLPLQPKVLGTGGNREINLPLIADDLWNRRGHLRPGALRQVRAGLEAKASEGQRPREPDSASGDGRAKRGARSAEKLVWTEHLGCGDFFRMQHTVVDTKLIQRQVRIRLAVLLRGTH